MTGTTYWRALDLNRHDVKVRCLFRNPAARSKGRLVYGKARKVAGLTAYLVGLEHVEVLGEDEPVDFFVVEVAYEPWQGLTERQRRALVDHELCHLDVEIPDGDEDRKLVLRGHDLEEFSEVVKRHGLWRPSVVEFTKIAKAAQLAFPIDAGSAGDVLRTGSGVVVNIRDGAR